MCALGTVQFSRFGFRGKKGKGLSIMTVWKHAVRGIKDGYQVKEGNVSSQH